MAAPRFPLIVLATLASMACLAGCRTARPARPDVASRAGSVAMELMPPPSGAAHMELPQNQRFVFPRQVEPIALPSYPAHLLSLAQDAVTACVEIDIGEDGGVTHARSRPDAGCDDMEDAAFGQAALQAVRQWRFEPALLCKAPDTRYADACLHPDTVTSPVAVRLSYAFRFSQREGVPRVERLRDGEGIPGVR